MRYFSSNLSIYGIKILFLCSFAACLSGDELKHFSPEQELFISPFSYKQVAIFSSGELTDTIVFYPVKERFEKIRDFERGFYDIYSKTVEYYLTPGSYHKNMEDSKIFLSMVNYSNIKGPELWLHFLELSFDEDGIIPNLKSGTATFDRSFARHKYTEAPKEHCIKEFKYENSVGVVEFTDCLGRKFIRK